MARVLLGFFYHIFACICFGTTAQADISTPGINSFPPLFGIVDDVDEQGVMHGKYFDLHGKISAVQVRNFALVVSPSALAELVVGRPVGCYEVYRNSGVSAGICHLSSNGRLFGGGNPIQFLLREQGAKSECTSWDRQVEAKGKLPINIKCEWRN